MHAIYILSRPLGPSLYGYDDVLMSCRSLKAGFRNAFLPHINIDHIDVGGDVFCDWKIKHATEHWKEFEQISEEYRTGIRNIYYNGIGYEIVTENGIDYYISKRI